MVCWRRSPLTILILVFAVTDAVIEEKFLHTVHPSASDDTKYQHQLALPSKIQCAAFCEQDSDCKSFSFDKGSKSCTLSTRLLLERGSKVYLKASRSALCPFDRGYLYYIEHNLCIKHFSASKRFSTANSSCVNQEAGHLLVIDSTEVFSAVIMIMIHIDSKDIWISAYKPDGKGEFLAWNGEPLTFLPGSPLGECLIINISDVDDPDDEKVFEDDDCHDTHQYFCQIDV